jgi:hypothetical protein
MQVRLRHTVLQQLAAGCCTLITPTDSLQVPLQFAAVVDVVVVRAVAVVAADVVVAAMTATAHPAGSLTGMMAPAGGELLLPLFVSLITHMLCQCCP